MAASAKTIPSLTWEQVSKLESPDLLKQLQSSDKGLHSSDAATRLVAFGRNEISSQQRTKGLKLLFSYIKDPLSLLLLALAGISAITGDIKATIIISLMMILSISLRYFQENRADHAAEKLKAMVHTTATVVRDGKQIEIRLTEVVPGDIVHLSSGDMIPADLCVLTSKDLYINQASLTGESLPVEKHSQHPADAGDGIFEQQNLCFMGTNVESGTAEALVYATGQHTQFGSLASKLSTTRQLTSFDKGVGAFTMLMLRFIAIMVPLVFLINGLSKGNWLEAFLFAMAVAVGLTPEMLPMIVTVNLSKGAVDLAKKKVIVKRLNSIQNLGAMDVLCTDKTGTLTEGRVTLIKHIDISGNENELILDYAYLNSHYQTGLRNLLDVAVLKHESELTKTFGTKYKKIDEVPFDFVRRRMSVVVEGPGHKHLLICKGAVEEVLAHSKNVQLKDKIEPLSKFHLESKTSIVNKLSEEGFRLVALGYKELPDDKTTYGVEDEKDLTLLGFLAFLDPPKKSAAAAIKELNAYGVQVKILTGDNEQVTLKICNDVGLPVDHVLIGSVLEKMTDAELNKVVEVTTVFDKLEPHHKERVIRSLQRCGHAVGFMGDGINDAPALKAADVGISVDTAVDIAKESSDLILLEQDLHVLKAGVKEGRRIFGNITKYIKMTASSNFGNMFSVLGGSLFLPFIPMLPIQVITNNLLYDMSQIGIPTDGVDDEYCKKPRTWRIEHIQKFILWIGPVSSIFDYLTYFTMLYIFNCWDNPALFHTGWFVESLVSQTLIIHIIRTQKVPFFQSRASKPLAISTAIIVLVGCLLPYSPLAKGLGFVPLPPLFWGILAVMAVAYFILAEGVKRLFIRKFGWE